MVNGRAMASGEKLTDLSGGIARFGLCEVNLGKCHEMKTATVLAHRLGPLTAQRKLPIVNSLRR